MFTGHNIIGYWIMSIFVVATLLGHRDLHIISIPSCPCHWVALSRIYTKVSRVPSSRVCFSPYQTPPTPWWSSASPHWVSSSAGRSWHSPSWRSQSPAPALAKRKNLSKQLINNIITVLYYYYVHFVSFKSMLESYVQEICLAGLELAKSQAKLL